MDIKIEPKNPFHISNNHFPQQTAFWAALKNAYGWLVNGFYIQLFDNGRRINYADMLMLIRNINVNQQMAYIPYIPFSIPENVHYGDMLEKLGDALRVYMPDDILFLRFDVPWESPWVHDHERFDDQGNWMGNPEPHIREMRMNFGTQKHALRKAFTDTLPTNTLLIETKKRPESLLKNMKSKTRYNIRLSERKGVTVRKADFDELSTWYDIYKQTARRNGIYCDDYPFFENVCRARHNDHDTALKLLLAEKNRKPLAGMFLTINNGRATYLYGASSSEQRNTMATYKLQWEALQLAHENHCEIYDMFGVAPSPDPSHPLYGLYRFKTGFGGTLFHRQGCWDYIFNEKQYQLFRITEQQMPGYHN